METNYTVSTFTVTLTADELDIIKESLVAGRSELRKHITDTYNEKHIVDILIKRLFTSHELSDKLNKVTPNESK